MENERLQERNEQLGMELREKSRKHAPIQELYDRREEKCWERYGVRLRVL
jgi:hypothetical protein